MTEKKNGSRNGSLIAICLVIALFLGVGVFGKGAFPGKTAKVSNTVIPLEADSRAKFKAFGGSFLQVTKDGAKYFADMDTQKWNDTYTMTSPVVVSEGGYTAVAELMGRTVRVYDSTGNIYSVSPSGSVVRLALNQNGYLSLVLYNATTASYKIEVYSTTGTLRMERSENTANVYPVAVDVSDDNKVLAVAYFDGDDMEVVSKVSLYYINESDGAAFADSQYMFAAVERRGSMVADIRFMEGNVLVGVSDLSVFGVTKEGKNVFDLPLSNELTACSLENKGYLALAYGKVLSGQEGVEAGTVEFFNLKGGSLGRFATGSSVHFLRCNDGITVAGADRDFYGLSKSGRLQWQYKATQDVEDMVMLQEPATVLVVTKTQAELLNVAAVELTPPAEEVEPGLSVSGTEE